MSKLYVGIAVGLFGVSTLGIILDIRQKRRSELHTFGSMVRQYFEYFILSFFGARMRKKLENDSANFEKVQEETLLKILKGNASTEYGVKYNFGDIRGKKQYVTMHPLTRYCHYKEYIGEIWRLLALVCVKWPCDRWLVQNTGHSLLATNQNSVLD